MCMLISCFGMMLDLVQRIITFLLACWIMCAICCVLLVAAVAGCAYGYNYSMAEFLTFTRSDVTVYMRRGQFYDRPDVIAKGSYRGFRRKGDEADAFPDGQMNENERADYESKLQPADSRPLANSWMNAQDSRQYAEKLTKYNPVFNRIGEAEQRVMGVQVDMNEESARRAQNEQAASIIEKIITPSPHSYYKMTKTHHVSRLISISPNILMSTAVWQSGSSKIIMRNFHVSTMRDAVAIFADQDEYEGRAPGLSFKNLVPTRVPYEEDMRPTNTQNMDFVPEDVTRSSVHKPLRTWEPPSTPLFSDYSEEVDEDNIIYKPG